MYYFSGVMYFSC